MLPTLDLDPTISEAQLEQAHATDPVDYDEVFRAIAERAAQDDTEGLGAGAQVPQTPTQALANAKRLSVDDVRVGVGLCLKTVRDPEFHIAALHPDAETAWEESTIKHPTSDPGAIPRGAVPFWTNGRFGHVALGAGGGMCWTTDYRRPGYVDLAPIASLASWCGGRLVGWAEEVNGVDLWPNKRPAPTFDLDDRIAIVRAALVRAKARKAPQARIDGLRKWLHQLETRRQNRK